MTSTSLISELTSRSNQIGIAFIIAMTTNDLSINYESIESMPDMEYKSPFDDHESKTSGSGSSSVTLFNSSDKTAEQQNAILQFASKIITYSTDLDADVKKALQDGYWDLI
jgi:hypothetical protein